MYEGAFWVVRPGQDLHNGRASRSVVEQKGRGIQVHNTLKVTSQVDKAVKRAFVMLFFINTDIKGRR